MKRTWPVLSLLLVSSCVLATASAPDARPSVEDDTDANRLFPGFRDAGGCAGDSSGTSGSATSGDACRDGAVGPGKPDATPCDVHTFAFESAAATNVWVTGSFTSPPWADESSGALAMTRVGSTFSVTTSPIGPGPHSYKFIIAGQAEWIPDPANPVQEPDGFGGHNSVVTLCGVN